MASSSNSANSRKRPAPSSPDATITDFRLECPICLDDLTEPKVLICGHNICPACSKKIMTKDSTGRFCYECPTCKRTTAVRKGLETNYGLRDMLEKANQMKDFYESMEAEKSRAESAEKNSAAQEDSIECYHCQKKCPAKDAFACTSPSCTVKKRHSFYVTFTSSEEEIDLWEVNKVCGTCACRQHRGHALEDMDSLAQSVGTANPYIIAAKMNESLAQYVKAKTPKTNLFSKINAHYETCFTDSLGKLRRPEKPFLRHEIQTMFDQMTETWQGTKTFFENEAKLSALVDECQMKIFTAYKESLTGIEKPTPSVVQAQVDILLGIGKKPTTSSKKAGDTATSSFNPATIPFFDVDRLKQELQSRNLDTRGNKDTLIARLVDNLSKKPTSSKNQTN